MELTGVVLLILAVAMILAGTVAYIAKRSRRLLSGQGSMRFGPNRVITEIRRAKRNEFGEPLRGADGQILYKDSVERHVNYNITVTAALLAAKDRLFNTATAQTVAQYIALSCSTHTPVVGDTTLDAEIAAGGLERAAGTYSVAGCGNGECILSHEFTASATHTDVQLMGLFDAAAVGDLYFEAVITLATLISGDKITAKWDKITMS